MLYERKHLNEQLDKIDKINLDFAQIVKRLKLNLKIYNEDFKRIAFIEIYREAIKVEEKYNGFTEISLTKLLESEFYEPVYKIFPDAIF